jgi:adenylylsulfate kinase
MDKNTSEIASCVVWFTGLPAAGKTTLAEALLRKLQNLNCAVEHLDGDVIRQHFPNTGFSRKERNDHIERVGWAASLLEKNGIVVIASLVSPYQESRDFVRKLCRNFIEVYVSTPLAVCESRDPKGLYRKARAGQIQQMTGIDDPYEIPTNPEFNIDSQDASTEELATKLIKEIQARMELHEGHSNKTAAAVE